MVLFQNWAHDLPFKTVLRFLVLCTNDAFSGNSALTMVYDVIFPLKFLSFFFPPFLIFIISLHRYFDELLRESILACLLPAC